MPRTKGAQQNESVTFRIESGCLGELRKEAEQKQISINTLVNQILSQHIKWYSQATNAGFTLVKKNLLANMMDKISEEELVKITNQIAKEELRDTVLLLRGKYNLSSALDVFDNWAKAAGHSHHHNIAGNMHSYLIQHNLGKKYSLILSEGYRFLFEELDMPRVEFNMTDNTLSFDIDLAKT